MTDWTLYSSNRSPFVRKVRMALAEAGLTGRVRDIAVVTNPMTPAPELAGVAPLGMIPVLVIEGGEVIADSHAILDYLGDFLPSLFAPAGAARRDCLRRHAQADGMMDKAVRSLGERFRTQNADTAAHIAGFAAAIRAVLDVWEAEAPDWTRALPDAGDIAVFCALAYLDFRFADLAWRQGHPALAAWFAGFAARPSAQDSAHPG